jgi:hypothetical protein
VKFNVGEEGPDGIPIDGARELGNVRVIELDRGPIEGFREEASEAGKVGARARGCCRIRRRPDAPRPCSCSVMTRDLIEECGQP